MSRIEQYLKRAMAEKLCSGRYPYTLIEFWDNEGDNGVVVGFDEILQAGEAIVIDDVEYIVEECDWSAVKKQGMALIRMYRCKIPDTATTYVHKCPAKKQHVENLTADDILKLEKRYGKKKTDSWLQSNKIKLRTFSKLETKCEHCGVVFWKDKRDLPDTVQVDSGLDKIEDEAYEGGLEVEDLEKQVADGTWLQIGEEDEGVT